MNQLIIHLIPPSDAFGVGTFDTLLDLMKLANLQGLEPKVTISSQGTEKGLPLESIARLEQVYQGLLAAEKANWSIEQLQRLDAKVVFVSKAKTALTQLFKVLQDQQTQEDEVKIRRIPHPKNHAKWMEATRSRLLVPTNPQKEMKWQFARILNEQDQAKIDMLWQYLHNNQLKDLLNYAQQILKEQRQGEWQESLLGFVDELNTSWKKISAGKLKKGSVEESKAKLRQRMEQLINSIESLLWGDVKSGFRYPGSRSFTPAFESLLFGREQDLKKIKARLEVGRFLVLHGKSGTGKSSLIQAKLAPQLEREYNYWVMPIRFSAHLIRSQAEKEQLIKLQKKEGTPLANFREQLEAITLLLNQHKDILPESKFKQYTLWQMFRYLPIIFEKNGGKLPLDGVPITTSGFEVLKKYHPNKTLLLIFDQLEELFTYPEVSQEAFASQLMELYGRALPSYVKIDSDNRETRAILKQASNTKILFTIRSSKYSLINRLEHIILGINHNNYELKPLDRAAAIAAIVAPAEKQDTAFFVPAFGYKKEALDKMLDYLSSKGEKEIESFQLQIICQHLEQKLYGEQKIY